MPYAEAALLQHAVQVNAAQTRSCLIIDSSLYIIFVLFSTVPNVSSSRVASEEGIFLRFLCTIVLSRFPGSAILNTTDRVPQASHPDSAGCQTSPDLVNAVFPVLDRPHKRGVVGLTAGDGNCHPVWLCSRTFPWMRLLHILSAPKSPIFSVPILRQNTRRISCGCFVCVRF